MEKSIQIASLVKSMIGYKQTIHVSEYCYNCYFNGEPRKKTLIIIPEKLGDQGVIAIDKPLSEVTDLDIIKNYKRLKQAV